MLYSTREQWKERREIDHGVADVVVVVRTNVDGAHKRERMVLCLVVESWDIPTHGVRNS